MADSAPLALGDRMSWAPPHSSPYARAHGALVPCVVVGVRERSVTIRLARRTPGPRPFAFVVTRRTYLYRREGFDWHVDELDKVKRAEHAARENADA